MKILYFGTVCDISEYNALLEDCPNKPSVAPIVFETALLKGFAENEAEIEIHSFPMIPVFPKSKLLKFGKKVEKLSCGYDCRWLNTINVPVLKQLSRRLDARRIIKKWAKDNKDSGVIVTYSIPPFLVKDVIKYSREFGIKSIAIVPDLLRDMYANEQPDSFITKLKKLYISPAMKLQGEYDGYVYLTDAMHEQVAPEKPYLVMEGIADASSVTTPDLNQKSGKKAIMYAGMLHEKYGLLNLLDAFEMLDAENTELWLFGEGTAKEEVLKRSKTNDRIRYFGTVDRETVLEYEKRATLLVNPRDTKEDFTRYSFPSKTIEYMLSGTPFLTTKLKGIPEEYYEYTFSCDDNEPKTLSEAITNALSLGETELNDFGKKAQAFVASQKNALSQTARIIGFIKEV